MPFMPRDEQPDACEETSDGAGWWHGRLLRDLALAVPPTLIVLGATFLIEALRHERVLFASLASSAFLIYRAPNHPMNGVRVMVTAHLVGVALGFGTATIMGAGYLAGAAAMVATIVTLILLDAVHPPAVSTALGFAFFERKDQSAGLFVVALVMLAALVLLQRAAVWAMRRFEESEGEYD